MALYEQLTSIDVYGPIEAQLRQGMWKVDADGKIRLKGQVAIWDEAWIRHWVVSDRLCHLWLGIYFKYYQVIPTKCRQCWKVVLRIDSLRQLMSVMQTLPKMEYNCKCGLETRGYSGGIGGYRGFFYTPIGDGVTGGRKLLKVVRKTFPGMESFLKRGCTEMEMMYPPSDKWDEFAEKSQWDFKTNLLDSIFVPDEAPPQQPTSMQNTALIRWIRWAFEHGDQTYRDYVDGDMVPAPIRYDNSNGSYNEPILEKETTDESDGNAKLISLR